MRKIFRDYAEVDERILVGYYVSNARKDINADETGILIELEKYVEGGVLGIDICYDPSEKSEEIPFSITNEYIKRVSEECPIAKEIATQKMEELVSDLKIDYEVSVEVCGEDDDVNTLQSKELYEKAQIVLEYLKRGGIAKYEQN